MIIPLGPAAANLFDWLPSARAEVLITLVNYSSGTVSCTVWLNGSIAETLAVSPQSLAVTQAVTVTQADKIDVSAGVADAVLAFISEARMVSGIDPVAPGIRQVALASDKDDFIVTPWTLDLGDVDPSSIFLVCVTSEGDWIPADLTSLKMDGQALTPIEKTVATNPNNAISAVFLAGMPANPNSVLFELQIGQTGDPPPHSVSIEVHEVHGFADPQVHDMLSVAAPTGVHTQGTIDVPGPGAVAAILSGVNRIGPYTVTGLTKTSDFDKEFSDWHAGANGFFPAAIADHLVKFEGATSQVAALTVVSVRDGPGQPPPPPPPGGSIPPGQLAGLLTWYAADQGVTQSAGDVSAVSDLSGNGHDLTVGSGAVKLIASAVDSLPAFKFDPGTLVSSAFAPATPITIAAVIKIDSSNNGPRGFTLAASQGPSLVMRNLAWQMQKDGVADGAQVPVGDTNYHLLIMEYDASESRISEGANAPVAGAALIVSADQVILGDNAVGGSWNGLLSVAEFVATAEILDQATRDGLINYFASRYPSL